ncbi:MAG: peptidase S8, partial [Ignavibacteriaceae bacterium]|nr:peptidase S8 [Ignavibacteriaceae bacterium]
GSEVVTLVNAEQQPGYYEVQFNGSNLASGMYVYRLQAGEYISTKKMLMIK